MNKELTPLEALNEIGKLKENGCYVNTTVEYEIVETALKALEIIKEKQVDLFKVAYTNTKEEYNDMVSEHRRELTQEEFDLLKEWLENGKEEN